MTGVAAVTADTAVTAVTAVTAATAGVAVVATGVPDVRAMVLVVDDSPENLTLMHGLLKDTYRVRAAISGEKALLIARSDAPPDLILLDIMMPDMDGYEVCRRLGADPGTARIPVIFLTARTEEEDERKGLDIGAVDYIVKPANASIVLARVRNHLALKALSDALREQNVELALARTVAEQANRAKSEFLSRMSHELRSPLNAIIGFAQLMESETPPPTAWQRSSLTQILQGGWYLLELINEILDLAAIESGRLTPTMESVDLGRLLPECEDLMSDLARKRTITLVLPATASATLVHADRMRLKQVIINLLSNAIKYNRPGGSVTVRWQPCAPAGVRMTVTDTGAGLAPDQVARLFESFNRLGRESSDEQGTGIGLVVSRRLVELMGGRIGAESVEGVGSTFWVELVSAAHAAPVDETDPAAPPITTPTLPAGKTMHRVLYIEDNPANLKLVEQLIERRPDLRMLSAGDAVYGIELARTARPQLIIMDINLPGIDGFEALRLLRTDPVTCGIPVVALSVNAQPRDEARGLKAGFFRYLTKPLQVRVFMDTLDAAIASRTAAEPHTG